MRGGVKDRRALTFLPESWGGDISQPRGDSPAPPIEDNRAMRSDYLRNAAFAAICSIAAIVVAPEARAAQMEAVYDISLAGFSVGVADVKSRFDGRAYEIDLQARLTGLAGLLMSGRGAASASGSVSGTRVVPRAFAVNSRSSRASRTVRMGLRSGAIAAVEIEPPLTQHPDTVPVLRQHKQGVVDPVSAFLMPATVRGELTNPRNCERTIPVFDGASRFDIVLSYGGTRQIDKPGYAGPVIVCNARFKAIAGHRPGRDAVRFMEENRDMSVWLAPFEANRSLLPMRIEVRTQLGLSVIEASRVTIDGQPRRAASLDARD
ncbi:MAG: DUF3108 domain-containing protein [Salinarimonadaceae bacterium]|nr:MAG: DUF3108 domain-containing protein [Salinarimonadaceae bacterium]